MTKRKPRRKAPQKAGRPTGWIWWAVGLLSLGGIIFDINGSAVSSHAPMLASDMEEPRSRPASVAAPRLPPAQARPQAAPPRPPASQAASLKSVAAPPAGPALRRNAPAPVKIVPRTRPGVRSAAAAEGVVTGRPTPLYRQPSFEAPIWVLLEAGRPLRVRERRGPWRRVESGIFTGWINAEVVEKPALSGAVPTRSAEAKAAEDHPVHPVPRRAIPDSRP